MEHVRETAIGFIICYAFLALFGGSLLVISNHLETWSAFLAGAHIALIFALGLIMKLRRLNEHSIVRCDFWRVLPSQERSCGESGRRAAHAIVERVWVHSARGAAAVAIVLCGLALASHHDGTSASAQTSPDEGSTLAADE